MNLGQAQPDQIQGGKDLGKKASLWPFTSVWHLLPTGCRDFAQGLYCPHHAMNAKAPSFFLLPGILHLVYKTSPCSSWVGLGPWSPYPLPTSSILGLEQLAGVAEWL